jgi:CheY-like chemotaxis protein
MVGQSAPPGRPVVLVVEDMPLLRLDAVDLVEGAGFEVVEARSVEDAIRILETRPDIRIVFTDIDMPHGLDGMRLATTIRDRWPPIEVILTSSNFTPPEADLPARCVFIPKPYRPERIVEALHRFAV